MVKSLNIKCVVVGDKGVGKTSFIQRYITQSFHGSPETVPAMLASAVQKVCDNNPVDWTLWDTKSTDDFNAMRPFAYVAVDVFMLCFSLNDIESLRSISTKFYPEIERYEVPFILVGCKSDSKDGSVPHEEAVKMARKIEAAQYMEVSNVNGANVDEAFNEAMRAFLSPPLFSKKKKKK